MTKNNYMYNIISKKKKFNCLCFDIYKTKKYYIILKKFTNTIIEINSNFSIFFKLFLNKKYINLIFDFYKLLIFSFTKTCRKTYYKYKYFYIKLC